MTAASLAELKSGLALGRQRLLDAIAGVSEQQFKKRPAVTSDDPQAWSIAEILAHLLASESTWTRRIRLALSEDGALIEPTDPDVADAAVRAGRQAPVPQLIHGLLASQRELERLLVEVDAQDAWQRTVTHSKRGPISVGWMVNIFAIAHAHEHVDQIEALKRRLAAEASA